MKLPLKKKKEEEENQEGVQQQSFIVLIPCQNIREVENRGLEELNFTQYKTTSACIYTQAMKV